MSVVLNFLLSSGRFLCEDSYFQSESFQKISGEKFERIPGLTHDDNFLSFDENLRFFLESINLVDTVL